ncbi:MAG TPA: U32 family peptidase [Candidatus Gastranaerophilales bacterium]|nr:U32 family peptidase [Candidatus Gastranaerophilales bacterium]
MKKIELLAPAKDYQTGITAIQCGADAVYIGANRFGARINAANSLDDIEKLVKYAHKYWAKVYVTVNTILNDREIIEAGDLIHQLYELGVDAIIIQDMGILELDLPPIPLFASTQAHNNTWQKVDFLEKVGFQRAILPRELSLEQIKEIKQKTNIDLEFFVHGALCVSYSGQCYLSCANGGRSGNRGECAQPCRKRYSLTDSKGKLLAKDKYLLSLKDLNLSDYLDSLIEAGVSSFKIEGRLKDIDYIKNIVSYYRQKIDKTNSGFEFNPNKTFNRGYTSYFLTGRNKNIVSFDSPKHIGEPIGLIETAKLNNGDGITYFDERNILQGTNQPKLIQKGVFIYRNFDYEYLKQLKSLKIERKIKLKIDFNNDNLLLTDENGNITEYKVNQTFESAKNSEMARQNIIKQLSKLGDTDFYTDEININLDPMPFIPVSTLNELRRQAIEQLEHQRACNFPKNLFKIVPNNYPYPEQTLDYSANVLNKYAEQFYCRHGVMKIEPAAESGINMTGKKLMTTKHCLKYQFNLCKKSSEPLYLTGEYNKYRLEFDCEKCEMSVYL